MMETQKHKELLEKLYEENMLWFFLGVLISDMTCSDLHLIKSSNNMVEVLKETLKVENVDLPQDVLESISKYLDNATEILEQSYKDLSK